jgi:hypothetical protein
MRVLTYDPLGLVHDGEMIQESSDNLESQPSNCLSLGGCHGTAIWLSFTGNGNTSLLQTFVYRESIHFAAR